jgi:hypothetical protein
MTTPNLPDVGPGGWQDRMIQRVFALGYKGFSYGPGVRWWVLGDDGKEKYGPFRSTGEFDAWLDAREAER